MASLEETEDYLYRLRNGGVKYGIERMEVFAEALGHPQRQYPTVHVAGTNGKGSTCAMLESVFREAGYKTGLFTSPHLVYLGERAQVNRVPISEECLIEGVGRLRTDAELISLEDSKMHPSFFEFMAALAFVHFAAEKVDIGVVETGLGGRLDATNVLLPEVSVITSIGLDHTDILGDTIEAIAGEKAGIIKPGVPVVVGRLQEEAEAVILDVAKSHGCEVLRVVDLFGEEIEAYPKSNLKGSFQCINAATTKAVCELLEPKFPGLIGAFEGAIQKVEWSGRWQSFALACGRTLILDATHNAEGAVMLAENLEALERRERERPDVIFGVLGASRVSDMIPVLLKYGESLCYVQPDQPRACSFDQVKSFIPESSSVAIGESYLEVLFPEPGKCALPRRSNTIVVTGSLYLIGDILSRLTRVSAAKNLAMQDDLSKVRKQ